MKRLIVQNLGSCRNIASEWADMLAAEIGWTAEGTTTSEIMVYKKEIPIYFVFAFTDYVITLQTRTSTVNSRPYTLISNYNPEEATPRTYAIDVMKSAEGTIAIGSCGDVTTGVHNLKLIIAQNLNGDYVGLYPSKKDGDATGDVGSASFISLRDNQSPSDPSTFVPGMAYYTKDSPYTVIVRLPDVRGGCMFKDLYAVFACPRNGTGRTLYINGINYRVVCFYTDYGGIAIPDID